MSTRVIFPRLGADAEASEIATALGEVGCVVVTNVLTEAQRASVREELAPYMARTKVAADDPKAFYPGLTRRTSALVARSDTAGGMALHPHTTRLCDHFLKPNGEFGCT